MRGRKGNKKERIDRITRYLEVAGSYRVPNQVKDELAKELGVTRRQINLDINKILTEIIEPNLNKLKRQFVMTLNSSMDASHELLRSQDPDIKAKGISATTKTIQTYTDFLERFGFKETITQKHQFEGVSATFNLVEKSVEEIKKDKNEAINSESEADGDSQDTGR